MRNLFFISIVFVLSCQESTNETLSNNDSDGISGKIAFVSDRRGNADIYTIRPGTHDIIQLTKNSKVDFSPSWSSDGQQLAFYSHRSGNAEIYVMDADGTHLRQVTNHPADDILPSFSFDQQKIVFISKRDNLGRNVYMINADGTGIQQLTKNEHFEESPSFSPDGNSIVFTRELRDKGETEHAGNGEIYRYHLQRKSTKRLTKKKGYDSGAKYSPDGSKIAFYGEANDLWNIYLMDPDGKNMINLTNDSTECYSPSWSPDGRWIAYAAGDASNYEIWAINVESREKFFVTNSPYRDEAPSWGRD